MCQVVEVVVIQAPLLPLPPQVTKYLNIGQAVHPSILTQPMHHQGAIVSQIHGGLQQQQILGTKAFALE